MLPLSIGILSWGQHATLRNTLETYKQYGLLDLAAHTFIFFQEISPADTAIADEYNLTSIYGTNRNLGIAGGYRFMLDKVTQPVYLFLENDWAIIHPPKRPVAELIGEGWSYLNTEMADVVRYRSREHPGNPLWTRQFEGNELSRPEHLLDAIHWTEDLAASFPNHILKGSNGWYSTSAPYANWTNNPHMVRTAWAKEIIEPRLGDRDIERDLQAWWQTQYSIEVFQGDGLFTHWRIG